MDTLAAQPEAAADDTTTVHVAQVADTQAQDAYDPESFYEDDKPKVAAPQEGDASEGDEGEGVEQSEAVEAPLSWAKDAKEVFAKLPPEAQAIISEREKAREASLQTKFREAASTRQQVETEARTALQTIMQNHAQTLKQYQAQFDVPKPDPRLLQTGDPSHRDLYFNQLAEYESASAQRDAITQQMSEAEQHAQVIAQQEQAAELQAEHQFLEEKLGTDWSDPSSRAKLLGELGPIAAELGYPQELIANARGVDIVAMKKTAEWKAKADKLDALNKAKMEPVRAARGIPPTSRPGSPAGTRAPVDTVALMYPNDVRRN